MHDCEREKTTKFEYSNQASLIQKHVGKYKCSCNCIDYELQSCKLQNLQLSGAFSRICCSNKNRKFLKNVWKEKNKQRVPKNFSTASSEKLTKFLLTIEKLKERHCFRGLNKKNN